LGKGFFPPSRDFCKRIPHGKKRSLLQSKQIQLQTPPGELILTKEKSPLVGNKKEFRLVQQSFKVITRQRKRGKRKNTIAETGKRGVLRDSRLSYQA